MPYQLPLSYNQKPTGRGDDYVDLTGMPLFPVRLGSLSKDIRLRGELIVK